MRKIAKIMGLCLLLAATAVVWSAGRQHRDLTDNVIRLHVVARSDSGEDQARKLLVRDAILELLAPGIDAVGDIREAEAYIRKNLDEIQRTAEQTLHQAGVEETVTVSLEEEPFDTRFYDTFRLPAGVYRSLRVTIGPGEGKNWWCVVFPGLCVPNTEEAFERAAVDAGMDEALACALAGEERYEVRFFLLDFLGKLENRLFGR